MDGRLDDARRTLVKAQNEFERMEMQKGVADCLAILGQIALKEGQDGDVGTALQEAPGMFEKMGAMVSLGGCVALLSDLPSADEAPISG